MGGKRVEAQTTIKLTDCGHHSSRGGGSVINGVVSLHAVITMTPGDNNSPQCLSVWCCARGWGRRMNWRSQGIVI